MLFGIRHGWNLLLVPEFDPDEVMQLVKEEKPIIFAGVPTDFMALHGYSGMEEYLDLSPGCEQRYCRD